MGNVSDKSVENIKTHFIINIFPPTQIRTVYEIMWKNMVQTTYDNVIWGMRIAFWITRATNTQSE